MALFPLTAAFRNDFVVLLVPVDDSDSMDLVAQKVADHVIERRLHSQNAPMRVLYKGQVLSASQTVTETNMEPMDFVEVFYDA